VDVDAPAITEKTLKRCRAENQDRVIKQRALRLGDTERRIDTPLDQPGQRDAGQIRGDQRENAEDQIAAVPVNEKFNAMVIAADVSIPWLPAEHLIVLVPREHDQRARKPGAGSANAEDPSRRCRPNLC
jgi:hypothetical protein